MTRERPYVPSEDFGTVDHDDFQLDWLEEARSNSDLYLLSGWARLRVETLRAERDSLATQLEDTKQVIVTFRATMEQMRRERDEARAQLAEANHALLGSSMAGVAIANRLDEARSKLARVREATDVWPSRGALVRMRDIVRRIIDEKEGGQ